MDAGSRGGIITTSPLPTAPQPVIRNQGDEGHSLFSLLPPAADIRFASTEESDSIRLQRTNSIDTGYQIHTERLMRLPEVEGERITFTGLASEQWQGVVADHKEFYSPESLTWLAAGFSVGAVMANTAFDDHFVRHNYLENVVNISEDDFYEAIHQPHFLGDGRYTIPVFAIAAFSEPLIAELPFGDFTSEWGQRSLRTILVGAPPMLAAQVWTGASRPGETSADSKWKPLRDSNGVSGHSFMGAIPFMSAAKITDKGWLKASLYALSAAPAVSRVNDDKHYFSQAFLGWWMAYLAATAVDRSHDAESNVDWFATPVGDGMGLGMLYQY